MIISIRKSAEKDVELIKSYMEEFSLDSKELDCEKLYIAEEKENLVGFGRYINYKNFHEIASIGVLKQFRELGVGKTLVANLIDIIPTQEIWITTATPEYFKFFGFKEKNKIPEELIFKSQRICKKFNKSIEYSVFMKLEKSI